MVCLGCPFRDVLWLPSRLDLLSIRGANHRRGLGMAEAQASSAEHPRVTLAHSWYLQWLRDEDAMHTKRSPLKPSRTGFGHTHKHPVLISTVE